MLKLGLEQLGARFTPSASPVLVYEPGQHVAAQVSTTHTQVEQVLVEHAAYEAEVHGHTLVVHVPAAAQDNWTLYADTQEEAVVLQVSTVPVSGDFSLEAPYAPGDYTLEFYHGEHITAQVEFTVTAEGKITNVHVEHPEEHEEEGHHEHHESHEHHVGDHVHVHHSHHTEHVHQHEHPHLPHAEHLEHHHSHAHHHEHGHDEHHYAAIERESSHRTEMALLGNIDDSLAGLPLEVQANIRPLIEAILADEQLGEDQRKEFIKSVFSGVLKELRHPDKSHPSADYTPKGEVPSGNEMVASDLPEESTEFEPVDAVFLQGIRVDEDQSIDIPVADELEDSLRPIALAIATASVAASRRVRRTLRLPI
jgi:hypothetical protein